MHTRTTATTALLALTLALTGCSSSDTSDKGSGDTKPSTSAPALTDKQRASIRADNGLPPTPAAADWAAYIKGLDAINPDIVHGKEDKAISRGIDSCSSIKNFPKDKAKQIELTGHRYTSPTHPEGRDAATAKKILALAHKHICPDF